MQNCLTMKHELSGTRTLNSIKHNCNIVTSYSSVRNSIIVTNMIFDIVKLYTLMIAKR